MSICPICESVKVRPFLAIGDQPLLLCVDCRHVWWASTPSAEFLAGYYRDQYTREHNQDTIQTEAREYYRGHAADLLRRLGMEAGECTILDYGCSYPVFLQEAKACGFARAIGVDYAKEAFAADARGVELLRPDQLGQLGDAKLDIARFSHTLEHLVDPVATLRQVTKRVRKGGLVYITQPSFPVFFPERPPSSLKDAVYPEHLHFFSPISVAILTSRCGLVVDTLFTHTNEEKRLEEYAGLIDEDYAAARMERYQERGDPLFAKGGYPRYPGENSSVYTHRA